MSNRKGKVMTILYVLLAVVAVLIVIVSLQPSGFSVSRSAKIAAPADVVFEQVSDLHRFQDWSPWAKRDPNGKLTYSGPQAGTGASFSWAGNAQVGEGQMTITESRPNELVLFKLDFLKPFQATNTAEFTFKSEDGQTLVKWTMSGRRNFFMKAFGLFINCDKMIGGDFEQGLANLKTLSESALARK